MAQRLYVTQKVLYALSFEVFYDSKTKISVILNFQTLTEELEDAALTLEGLLCSAHCKPVQAPLHALLALARDSKTFVQNALVAQTDFLTLRKVFGNPRSLRQLQLCVPLYKVADELYRHVTQQLKNDLCVLHRVSTECPNHSTNKDGLLILEVLELQAALARTRTEVLSYGKTMTATWPKMHLLPFSSLLAVLSSADSLDAFASVRSVLFPHITNITGDPTDDLHASVLGCTSGGEALRFAKEVSARQSVAEWMLAVNTATSTRLHDDVRDIFAHKAFRKGNTTAWIKETLLAGTENTASAFLEQARLSCLQAQFWDRLIFALTPDEGADGGRSPRALLAEHQEELTLQIVALSRLRAELPNIADVPAEMHDKLQMICQSLANVMVSFCTHRDILVALLEDSPYALHLSSFVLQSQLQKVSTKHKVQIKGSTKSSVETGIHVVLAGEKMPYGYAYHGFGDFATTKAVFITPLTQRYFHAISRSLKAARDNTATEILLLQGPAGGGKRDTMRALASETGCEHVEVDCAAEKDVVSVVQNALKSSVGCFHWLSLRGIEGCSDLALTGVWAALQSAVDALDKYGQAAAAGHINKENLIQLRYGTPCRVVTRVAVVKAPSVIAANEDDMQGAEDLPQSEELGVELSKHLPQEEIEYELVESWDDSMCTYVTLPVRAAHVPLLSLLMSHPTFTATTVLPRELIKRLHILDVHRPLQAVSLECLLITHDVPQECAAAAAQRLFALAQHAVAEGLLPQEKVWPLLLRCVKEALPAVLVSQKAEYNEQHLERLPPLMLANRKAKQEADITGAVAKGMLRCGLCTGLLHRGTAATNGIVVSNQAPRCDWSSWDMMYHLSLIQDMLQLFVHPAVFHSTDVGLSPSGSLKENSLEELVEYLPTALRALVPTLLPAICKQSLAAVNANAKRLSYVKDKESEPEAAVIDIPIAVPTPEASLLDFLAGSACDMPCLVIGSVGVGKSSSVRLAGHAANACIIAINPFLRAMWGAQPLDLLKAAAQQASAEKQKSILHVDLNSSAELDSVLLPMHTELAALEKPPHVLYEMCDTRHASPSALCTARVVLIPTAVYSVEDVLKVEIETICGPVGGEELHHLLLECVRLYILPCYNFLVSTDAAKPPNCAFPAQCLQLVHSILLAFKMLPNFERATHARSLRRIALYTCIWTFGIRPREHGSSMKRSENVRAAFDSWFKSNFFSELNPDMEYEDEENASIVQQRIAEQEEQGQEDTRNVFPQIPEGMTVFDLCLTPLERPIRAAGVHLVWMQLPSWMDSTMTTGTRIVPSEHLQLFGPSTEERLAHAHYDPTSQRRSAPDTGSMYVPTSTSIAMSFLHTCALRVASDIRSPSILIVGAVGSGKRSLMTQIMYAQERKQMDAIFAVGRVGTLSEDRTRAYTAHSLFRRWIAVCGDSRFAQPVMNAIRAAKTKARAVLAEADFQHGVIVVEDLHLDAAEVANALHTGPSLASFLHWLASKTVGEKDKPSLLLSRSARSTSSPGSGRGAERLLGSCIHVQLDDTEHGTVHASMLAALCPSLRTDILIDVVSLTQAVLRSTCRAWDAMIFAQQDETAEGEEREHNDESCWKAYMNVQHRILQLEPASRSCQRIIRALNDGLCSLPHFTTNEVLRLWDRIVCCDLFANHTEKAGEFLQAAVNDAASNADLYVGRDFHSLLRRELRARADKEAQRILAPENSEISEKEGLCARWAAVPIFAAPENDSTWPGVAAWNSTALARLPDIPAFRANVLRIQAFAESRETTENIPALLMFGQPQEMLMARAAVSVAATTPDAEKGYYFCAIQNARDVQKALTEFSIHAQSTARKAHAIFHAHIVDENTSTSAPSPLRHLLTGRTGARIVVTFESHNAALAMFESVIRFNPETLRTVRVASMCPLNTIPIAELNVLQVFLQNVMGEEEIPNMEDEQEAVDSDADFLAALQAMLQDDVLIDTVTMHARSLLFALPSPIKEAADRLKRFIRRVCTATKPDEYATKPPGDDTITGGSRRKTARNNQDILTVRESFVGDDFPAAQFVLFLKNECSTYNSAVSLLGRHTTMLCSAKGVRDYVLRLAESLLQQEAASVNAYARAVKASRRQAFLSSIQELAYARIKRPQHAVRIRYNITEDQTELRYASASFGYLGMRACPEPFSSMQGHLQSRLDMLTAAQAAITGLSVTKVPTVSIIYQLSLSLELLNCPSGIFHTLQCGGRKGRRCYLLDANVDAAGLGFVEGQVNASLAIGTKTFLLFHGPVAPHVRVGHVELARKAEDVERLGVGGESAVYLIRSWFASEI